MPPRPLSQTPLKLHPINVGDFVLCHTEAVALAGEHGKLKVNWEGLYKVVAQIRPGTYRLETPQRTPTPLTWHSSNLRKYYHWYFSFVKAHHPCSSVLHAINTMVVNTLLHSSQRPTPLAPIGATVLP